MHLFNYTSFFPLLTYGYDARPEMTLLLDLTATVQRQIKDIFIAIATGNVKKVEKLINISSFYDLGKLN